MTMTITQLEKVQMLIKLKSRVLRVWGFQICNQFLQIDNIKFSRPVFCANPESGVQFTLSRHNSMIFITKFLKYSIDFECDHQQLVLIIEPQCICVSKRLE